MVQAVAARAPVCRAVAEEVQAYCRANADPERSQKYSRYFKEGYDAYGVDLQSPAGVEKRREWTQRLREAGPTAFLDAGDLLVQSGKYEEASLAILFAAEFRDVYTERAFERVGMWFERGIRNWAHTDVLCSEVLSRFLIEGVVTLRHLEAWLHSVQKFQRRAVPVMLIKLLDYPLDLGALLRFIEPLMLDSEKVVHQGVGWFLREVWKRDASLTEELLLRYRDTAPRLIMQYATEKMTPVARTRFRRQR